MTVNNALFLAALAACQRRQNATLMSAISVAPYAATNHPGSGYGIALAPFLSDDVIQEIAAQEKNFVILHAGAQQGHQALIWRAAAHADLPALRAQSITLKVDLGYTRRALPWRWPALAIFDMDSTLITMEVIDELAHEAGVGTQVAAITESAMRGELDFNASLLARVASLRGLPLSALLRVRDRVQFSAGVPEWASVARAHHCKLAVVSGGFVPFAEHVQAQLQFDFARANHLGSADGVLTGAVLGDIVNAQTKADTVRELCVEYHIDASDVMAVGDGANDALMLRASAFSVAFRAKPALRAMADLALDHSAMSGLTALFIDA